MRWNSAVMMLRECDFRLTYFLNSASSSIALFVSKPERLALGFMMSSLTGISSLSKSF